MKYYYMSIKISKINRLTTPKAGADVEQLERSYITGGNIKRYNHLGKQFGSFLYLLYHPRIPLSGIKSNKNVCPYKNMDISIHRSFIHSSQKLETTQTSINR